MSYKIIPSPNFIHRKKVEQAVQENEGYCPCKIEKNDDNKCICKEFRELRRTDYCHCGRYYKVLDTQKICLCGSYLFKEKFFEEAALFTQQGYIVTMPLVFRNDLNDAERAILKELQKAKIAEADLIFVINVNEYIDESTRNEINWAAELGKKILYLNP